MSDHRTADPVDTYPSPPHGWTCFHCGETFTHPNAARLHFGAGVYDEAKCQISAHRLRAMQAERDRLRAAMEEVLRCNTRAEIFRVIKGALGK